MRRRAPRAVSRRREIENGPFSGSRRGRGLYGGRSHRADCFGRL